MATTYSIVLSGKREWVNILKSIDEGPFQMGMIREILVEGEEGALHLGPERAQVYSDLTPEYKKRGIGTVGNGGAQNRVGNVNLGQARQIKCYNCNDKMLLMQAQENGVVLDEEQLLFIASGQENVADKCDAFDSDVDEAPTAQTMFMENISFADPVYDEVGLSYDSDILSEVHDHDNYQDALCKLYEVHEMHDNVQPNCVVDSDAEYTNDAHTKVVDALLTAELATYKEQVKLYERRVKFELTEREQKIDEQLRMVITDRNIKEENLKKELHSVKIFTEMHDAHTVVQARCLELEVELSKLNAKIQHNDHNELLKRFSNLEVQINAKIKCITMDSVKPKGLAPGMYAINVEPLPPRCRKNREVHLDYLKHLKESVETLREIVEEARVERPLDRSLASACLYTKHSQELLEYVKTNVPVIPSTGVYSCTNASKSKPRSNTNKNRISPAKGVNKKKVEEHPRTNKSSSKKANCVDSSISSKRTIINLNYYSVCKTCNKCFIYANHDMCVVDYLNSVNASPFVKNVMRTVKMVWKPKQFKQVWKATGKLLTTVGYQWKPMGRIFTLGKQCLLTRLTQSKVVPIKQTKNVSTSKIV
nr:hypothetical protein [Tanacetum cinerariifolium]